MAKDSEICQIVDQKNEPIKSAKKIELINGTKSPDSIVILKPNVEKLDLRFENGTSDSKSLVNEESAKHSKIEEVTTPTNHSQTPTKSTPINPDKPLAEWDSSFDISSISDLSSKNSSSFEKVKKSFGFSQKGCVKEDEKENFANDLSNKDGEEFNKKKLVYSRAFLLGLRFVRQSDEWPSYFDPEYKKVSGDSTYRKMDLERWLRDKQDSKDSSGSSSAYVDLPSDFEFRRRDPRERVKVESDGVILSPQRRSFGFGCHISQPTLAHVNEKPENTYQGSRDSYRESRNYSRDSKELSRRDSRDIRDSGSQSREVKDPRDGSRKMGSNRIYKREEMNPIGDRGDRRKDRDEVDYNNGRRRDNWRGRNDSRFDDHRYTEKRRPDYEEESNYRKYNNNNNKRYNNDNRRNYHQQEEEPEWYTEGPTSQNDTIDLKGFDDDVNNEEEEFRNEVSVKAQNEKMEKGGSGRSSRRSTPVIVENAEQEKKDTDNEYREETGEAVENSNSLDEEILNNTDAEFQFDVENFLTELIEGSEDGRFSSGPSPITEMAQQNATRLYALQVQGMKEPFMKIPSPNNVDMSKFFTPISPANEANSSSGNIVEMLQQANTKRIQQPTPAVGSGRLPRPSLKDLLVNGRGQSLEDLEANFRKDQNPASSGNNMQHRPNNMPTQHNQAAYNTFMLNQHNVKNGPVNTHNGTEMMNHMRKNAADGQAMNMNGPNRMHIPNLNIPNQHIPQNGAPPPINMPPSQISPSRGVNQPSEAYMKALQQKKQMIFANYQQSQQQSQISAQQDPIKQLLGGMNNLQMNNDQDLTREKITRPDVQALLQRVISGHINNTALIAQLNTGNLTPQQRESVAIVLKLMNANKMQKANSAMGPTGSLSTQQPMLPGLNLGINPIVSAGGVPPNVDHPGQPGNLLQPSMMRPANRVPSLIPPGGAAPSSQMRLPSHEQLVAHTQNILQKALIKQQLESAKEKHRKRENDRIKSPNFPQSSIIQNGPIPANMTHPILNRTSRAESPTKGLKCQSPLAFTPTSVMRKMLAEKEKNEPDFDEKSREMERIQNLQMQAARMNLKSENMSNPGHNLPVGNSVLGPRAQMVMGHNSQMAMRQNHPMTPGVNPMMQQNLMQAPKNGLMPQQVAMNQMCQNTPQNFMNKGFMPPQRHAPAPHVTFQQRQPPQMNQVPQQVPPQQRQVPPQHQLPPQQLRSQQQMPHPQLPPQQNMPQPNQQMMNNIRALQQAQQASLNQQMRSQFNAQQMCQQNRNQVSRQPMPPAVNNFNKIGENAGNGDISSNMFSATGNFMNMIGRDVFSKVHPNAIPDMPGGKALSLEEVERM